VVIRVAGGREGGSALIHWRGLKTLVRRVVDTVNILLGVLLVAASVLCGVGIWALTEGVKTARSVRRLSDDLDARAVPLLDKADVTIDALNAELLRVDVIVTRIEEVTDRVESTSRTVQGVANAPGEIVTDIADRVRRAWKRRQSESAASRADAEDEPIAEEEYVTQEAPAAETAPAGTGGQADPQQEEHG
jgi:hypothetical protein